MIENYSRVRHTGGDYFFYKGSHIGEDFSYTYFASDFIIELIKVHFPDTNNREFLMDATFKVCPMGEFYQLLVIYFGICGTAIPFIYVLMSRKTEACYLHLFKTLRGLLPLDGRSFMTDFEVAMRNALRVVYPNVQQYSCWFHYCQAARKKCSKFPKLVKSLKSNEILKRAYYKLLALPLLPAADILACFQMVKSEFVDVPDAMMFLKYFEKQWLEKVITIIMNTAIIPTSLSSNHVTLTG